MPGLREAGAVDSAGMLELTELPRRLVVVGRGAIGCEFAQVFARLGSEVTMVLRARTSCGRSTRGDGVVAQRVRARRDPDVSETRVLG